MRTTGAPSALGQTGARRTASGLTHLPSAGAPENIGISDRACALFTDFNRIQRAITSAIRHACALHLTNMIKSSPAANAPVALPPLVAAFVEATNSFDVERLMATFAEDALVNDQLRDYWGKPAIREWAERDIVGVRLTMKVTKLIHHYGNFIATADVDGIFDKCGLPDPLVLAFYFTPHNNLIAQLIILRNRYDI
jgi:hypothetical protein